MAINNLLSKIFSDENAIGRGVNDLTTLFYDVATAPVRLNVALVKAAANSNLPGVALPAAMIPTAVFLALSAPAGLAGIAVGYGIVSAVTTFMGNALALVDGLEDCKDLYSALYPNTVKRVEANKQRKLAAR
jgi:hypothetical protein